MSGAAGALSDVPLGRSPSLEGATAGL